MCEDNTSGSCACQAAGLTGARLGVSSMSKENGESKLLRLYEWTHQRWPKYVDCTPICVEQSLRDAGYEIRNQEKAELLGLPSEIVVAVKTG